MDPDRWPRPWTLGAASRLVEVSIRLCVHAPDLNGQRSICFGPVRERDIPSVSCNEVGDARIQA